MTKEQRTIVRMALNDAKRAWMESQGGYRKVELDALYQERRVTEDDSIAARARAMRADGLSYHRIAKILRCSHGRVYGWCNPGYFAHKSRAAYRARKKNAA